MKASSSKNTIRGVSPVVAVILMVAITVILSAVIGTFVLNLGQQTTESQQSSIGVKTQQSTGQYTGTFTVTVVTGTASKLEVLVNGTVIKNKSDVKPGDEITVSVSPDSTVTIVDVSDGRRVVVTTKTIQTARAVHSIPTDGLVSLWRFDESLGSSTSIDSIGPYDGSNVNITSGVSGHESTAYRYNNESDNVQFGDNMFDTWSSFTVSAWVYAESINNTNDAHGVAHGILTKAGDGDSDDLPNGDDNMEFGLTSSGNVRLYIDNGANNGVTGGTTLTTGKWYHLVGVYNGSAIKVYVNGSLDGTSPVSGALINSTHVLHTASTHNHAYSWFGKIDDTLVYNRSLTDSEVRHLYNETK